MDTLIDSIRAAVADGATDDAKAAGAVACRAILAALEAQSGQPLAGAASAMAAPIASSIGNAFSALRAVPPDQLLDVVIAKLRAKLPADAALASATRPIAFHLVPLPRVGGRVP